MSSPVNQKPSRYDFLDAVRGVAALMVAFFHCALPTPISVFPLAGYCVDLFFVLSGFVIAANYQSRIENGMSGPQFMAFRVARLYPLFLIGLVLGLIGVAWQTHLGQTTYSWFELGFAFLYNLVYLPYFNLNEIHLQAKAIPGEIFPLNWPAWSLFFEMVINVIFFLNLRYLRIPAKKIVLAAFVPFAIIILLNHGDAGWGSKNWFLAIPRVAFGFFAGVWIYEVTQTAAYQTLATRLSPAKTGWMLAVMLAILLIVAWPNVATHRYAFFAGIIALPLLVTVSTALTTPDGLKPLFRFLGYLSYPIYCLHGAVIHLTEAANAQFNWDLHDWSHIWANFTVSLVLAALVALLVDEPLRKLLSARVSRWRTAKPAASNAGAQRPKLASS